MKRPTREDRIVEMLREYPAGLTTEQIQSRLCLCSRGDVLNIIRLARARGRVAHVGELSRGTPATWTAA